MSPQECEQRKQVLESLQKIWFCLMICSPDEVDMVQIDEDLHYVRCVIKGFDISVSVSKEG